MVKKLSLNLDELAVESFDTTKASRPAGTVRGYGFTETTCNQIICDCPTGGTCDTDCGQYTCVDDTCGGATCGSSCVNICPPTDAGERTCNQPSCFYSCACVSQAEYTVCCLQ